MKIVTILGARPQFIKAGSVSRELLKHDEISEVIVHTGQHYDENMSDIFFQEMEIPTPNYSLGIGGNSHGAMTGRMIEKIESVLEAEQADMVLVYGDTNSTLAGAIAASKMGIPIAHVEAGLRSFNQEMPEEINRIVTDRLSALLFCPTQTAMKNLTDEGVSHWGEKVVNVGDVMQDGAFYYKKLSKKPDEIDLETDRDFILCTVHRAENTNSEDKLKSIILALNELSMERSIVFPLHPRTRNKLEQFGINISDRVKIIEPVGYLNMVWLLLNCGLVVTDSGGLQKEAFFFEKPCLTLREETEWVELVDEGVNKLAGYDSGKIIYCYQNLMGNGDLSFNQDIYGNGEASVKIVSELMSFREGV